MTNKFNILVTGSNGQVGSEIRKLSKDYNYNFFFTTSTNLDITEDNKVKEYIESNKINTIINSAAYTAVDNAEEDSANANNINHLAIQNIAQISKDNNIKLIHISTDYVFDGKNFKPYCEDDKTNPNSVYGQTKLDGEKAILEYNLKNSIIIRTSWVYSSFGNNFVKTMLKLGKEKDSLGVIFDQVGTPTYAKDLAQTILAILPNIKNENVEIYHYSNEGVASWYDFSKAIMQEADINCTINPIESKAYPAPVKRPHYSVLNKSKIREKYNLEIPYWRDSLRACLKNLGEYK